MYSRSVLFMWFVGTPNSGRHRRRCLAFLEALFQASKPSKDELKNDKSLEFFIEPEVFGQTRKAWIIDLDVHRMATMGEVTRNCIVAYQRHLYNVLKNTRMLDMIAFVDLAMVGGEGCGTAKSKAEHLCARLMTSKPGQLFMVPYNSNEYWVLTVVDPEKERVYYTFTWTQ